MPTFVFDITKGKSRAELADDYLRCSRAAFHWQRIAMRLVERRPELLEEMPEQDRDEIKRIIEAYKD